MKTIIIVSKCIKVSPGNQSERNYHFHFKGVCAGESLKKVVLLARNDFNLRKGEEYLLYVQFLSFENAVLKGRVLKAKPLEECWDRS